ncbi:betaine-aldehyde dehydrogenase [Nocardiopsis mwathae]|uniref:aldehyde dehydrogenase (NAD(+)) n=1 Tax=Nocardiopsis mwathae TaxID=1472723 RepID=A0A7W9YHT2_9ACTN|nr:aldehyde dehydrogenase [Nocardiopsis mwathae]MBB6172419.1 betaine-aldehyde dehydrogenase [Nocardiopsis mwathae]
MRKHDRLYIGGEWVEPAGSGTIDVVSPHSEEVVGRVPEGTTADVDRAVEAARTAFDHGPWPRMAPAERGAVLARLADLYEARLDEVAGLITAEMGAPLNFSQAAQAPLPQRMLAYYGGLADDVTWEETRPGLLGPSHVVREPVGVAAAITPWNVPQLLIVAKVAPALLAGCTAVVKPAPETALDPYLLAELAEEAGVPAGVLNIVAADRAVGEHLVTHPGVDHVSFTGSTAAGRRIATLCGERLRGCSLELGGKSAAILLPDADLAAYTGMLTLTTLLNNGQACIAQARVLAPRERYGEVVDALAERLAGLAVGDPADPSTDIGPLVSPAQRERVEGYIGIGRAEGARVVTGGGRPADRKRGHYVEPTLFADVDNGMRIAREEIFGPVLAVIPYDDERHAIELANDSEYGLAGSVWTADPEHGVEVARRIHTGTCGVNVYNVDVNTPFGGRKASGMGREYGPEGLAEYLEYKTIPTLG